MLLVGYCDKNRRGGDPPSSEDREEPRPPSENGLSLTVFSFGILAEPLA